MGNVTKFLHTCPKCGRVWGHSGCSSTVLMTSLASNSQKCWECFPGKEVADGQEYCAFEDSQDEEVDVRDDFAIWARKARHSHVEVDKEEDAGKPM